MIKMVGILLILCGAGGFGIVKAYLFYGQLNLVKAFSDALQIMKCEMNYTLAPLPKLCATVGKRSKGNCAHFFISFSSLLKEGVPRSIAARRLLADEKKYQLPKDARMTLLELFENLGAYELEGENQLIRASIQRLQASHSLLEQEKKPLAKSYAALGICTGLALVILFV